MIKRILFINFLVIIINNFIHPISPELLINKQAPLMLNGFLYAMMSFASFLFSPIWGKKMEQIGIKKFLIIGPLGYGLVQWGFYLFTNPLALAVSRFLAGCFASMFIVGVSSYISIVSSYEKRSFYLAMITSTTALGAIVGQFISGFSAKFSLMLPFILLSCGSIIAAILIQILIKDYQVNENHQEKIKLVELFKLFKEKGLLLWLIIFVLITFWANIYNSNIGFFAKVHYDLNPMQVAFVNMIGNCVMLVANCFLINFVQNHFSFKLNIFLMIIAGIFGSLGILIFVDSKIMFLAMILSVISFALYKPIMQNYFLTKIKKHTALICGLLNSINSIGMITGGIISGISYAINPSLVFLLFLILCVIALIIFGFLISKHENY